MPLPEGPLSIPDLYYRSRGPPSHYSNTAMLLSYPCCDTVRSFPFILLNNSAHTISTCIPVHSFGSLLSNPFEACLLLIDGQILQILNSSVFLFIIFHLKK